MYQCIGAFVSHGRDLTDVMNGLLPRLPNFTCPAGAEFARLLL